MRRPDSAPPLLEVRDLSIDFMTRDQGAMHAVEKVSFALREGEILGVVGESGCGKTTAMLGILRLLPVAGRIVSGEVLFGGRDLLALSESEMADVRWKEIAMIFQGAMNALNPVHRVGDQIAEAYAQHASNTNRAAVDERVCRLLDMVGISRNRKSQYPHQYSGGMRQRAMIAMALACTPQVVIADEPTTALDVMVQAQILELLKTLCQSIDVAIIVVTHDLGVVAEVCDSVLVMYGGVAAEYTDVDTLFNAARHPYTRLLLDAFPDLTRPKDRLTSIPGYPPRLNDLPPGCRFAPRCPAAFDRCHVEQPGVAQLGRFHYASCFLVEPK
jgi:peptide/nickel transport system ATP-binding protein